MPFISNRVAPRQAPQEQSTLQQVAPSALALVQLLSNLQQGQQQGQRDKSLLELREKQFAVGRNNQITQLVSKAVGDKATNVQGKITENVSLFSQDLLKVQRSAEQVWNSEVAPFVRQMTRLKGVALRDKMAEFGDALPGLVASATDKVDTQLGAVTIQQLAFQQLQVLSESDSPVVKEAVDRITPLFARFNLAQSGVSPEEIRMDAINAYGRKLNDQLTSKKTAAQVALLNRISGQDVSASDITKFAGESNFDIDFARPASLEKGELSSLFRQEAFGDTSRTPLEAGIHKAGVLKTEQDALQRERQDAIQSTVGNVQGLASEGQIFDAVAEFYKGVPTAFMSGASGLLNEFEQSLGRGIGSKLRLPLAAGASAVGLPPSQDASPLPTNSEVDAGQNIGTPQPFMGPPASQPVLPPNLTLDLGGTQNSLNQLIQGVQQPSQEQMLLDLLLQRNRLQGPQVTQFNQVPQR